MAELIRGIDRLIEALRGGFTLVLLVGVALATVAWLERSRRVNAFSALAKFARRVCDPLIAPIEKRTARFGGTHENAPWIALLVLLLFGALFVGVLGFVRDLLVTTYYAGSRGPGGLLRLALSSAIAIVQIAVIARVVMSWFGGTYSRLGRLAFTLSEWLLAPLRRVIPPIRMIDITPLVAYFGLSLLRGFVLGSL